MNLCTTAVSGNQYVQSVHDRMSMIYVHLSRMAVNTYMRTVHKLAIGVAFGVYCGTRATLIRKIHKYLLFLYRHISLAPKILKIFFLFR